MHLKSDLKCSASENKKRCTIEWYEKEGWKLLSDWLIRLASSDIPYVYVENLEILPSDVDAAIFAGCLKRDGIDVVSEDGWLKINII